MAQSPDTNNRWFYFLFKKRLPVSLYFIVPLVVALIAFASGFIGLVLLEQFLESNHISSLSPIMKTEASRLLAWTRFEVLAFTTLGGIAGVGIVFAILNPLRKILDHTRKMAEGDFSSRIDAQGLDELGILGKDFNLMVSSLNDYFVDSMAGGWILLNTEGKIISANRGALNILQCESEDMVGQVFETLFDFLNIDPAMGSWIKESVQSQKEIVAKEFEARLKNSKVATLTLSTSLLQDKNDNFVGMAITLKDLTRANEITEKMQRADKLAALGGMAAGLAHEIRNPLGSIKGLTQLLSEEFKDGGRAHTYTKTMIREIDRINGVVTSLPHFSQPSHNEFQFCKINDLLEQALDLLQLNINKKNVQVMQVLDPRLPKFWGDSEKLIQAFLNLLLNAVQAVNESGEIRLITSFDLTRGDGVIFVRVKNTGKPIDPSIVPVLFDPFYTTKKEGTGLGLPITHQIISLHGGTLIHERSVEFTEFNIELPLVQKPKVKKTLTKFTHEA
ncbi:MAG: HAMP domain-containing protein [Nitrospinaceae bacterium]|nr:HAMP domain-containing protein [Nitrospinaceae bacterium]